MHHIRFFLISDEIASFVFGQAGLHGSEDLSMLAVGVELLAGLGGRCFPAGVVQSTIECQSKVVLMTTGKS